MTPNPVPPPIPPLDLAKSEAMSAALARNWWAVAIRGVLAILFGFIALVMPGVTILTLVLLFSAYMLVDGAFGIVSAFRAAQRDERWSLLALEGIVDIAAGVIAFLWPGITALVFVLLLAFWAIISGILMLAAAFRLNAQHGRWWLVLGGAVSLVWGVLLAFMPAVGAVVLAWWLGAYALIFGVMLLVLAFRLWNRHTGKPAPTHA